MSRLTAIRKQALDGMMKEALFEATVAVLSTHGVGELTMDRVASEAGIAKGSVYRYFRGKRDLLEFVYGKMVDPIFRTMGEIVAREQPAIDKLASQLRALFEHVAKHAQVHKLLFEDDAARGLLQSSERSTLEVARRQLAEIFQQGIAEGTFRPGDPLMLASMYLGLCKGVLESEPKLEDISERENLHRLILNTFLNGAATEEGASRWAAETRAADDLGT